MTQKKAYRNSNKHLCLDCLRTFKRVARGAEMLPCPVCRGPSVRMGHAFKPPPRSDRRQWKVIRFLVSQGLRYERWHRNPQDPSRVINLGPYPREMRAAREFARRYARKVS